MTSPQDTPPPNEKKLRFVSFAIHAARGLVRDQNTRRTTMFWTVIVAVVMLFCGATFLAPWLDPQVRPGWFIFYWLACAWVTVTVVLLAIFDLLLVRVQARAAKRRLAQEIRRPAGSRRCRLTTSRAAPRCHPPAGNRANKWRPTSGGRSRRLRKSQATRAAGNFPSRGTITERSFSAIARGSFIRALFAGWNTRRRFFSTGRRIICGRG